MMASGLSTSLEYQHSINNFKGIALLMRQVMCIFCIVNGLKWLKVKMAGMCIY